MHRPWGALHRCDPSVRPSVCLSVSCPNPKTVHFMGMVIVEQKWEIPYWSQTHWSEWPHGYRKWPKQAGHIVSPPSRRCLVGMSPNFCSEMYAGMHSGELAPPRAWQVFSHISVTINNFPARRYASAGTIAMALCPSVCLCLCHKSEFYRSSWTNRAGFATWASFHPCLYTVLKRNSGITKNKGTSFWNLVPNSGLRKFCFGISIVKTCCRISSTKVDARAW